MTRCCGRGVLAPRPAYSQAELRVRRLKWLSVDYGANFSLDAELNAILSPLASKASALSHPSVLAPEVAAVAAAAYDVVSWTVATLVERGRGNELAAPVRAFARIERGEVPDDAIRNGAWAVQLTEAARPFTAVLGAELGRKSSPSREGETVSDQLIRMLRGIDRAAHELAARTAKAAKIQARGTFAARQAERAAARLDAAAAKRLQKLGVK